MYLSLLNPGKIRQQAHNGIGGHGFAAPALSHDTHDLPLLQLEGHAPKDFVASLIVIKINFQVLDFQYYVIAHDVLSHSLH